MSVRYYSIHLVWLLLITGCSDPRVNPRISRDNLSIVSGGAVIQLPEEAACGRNEYEGPLVIILSSLNPERPTTRLEVISQPELFGANTSSALREANYIFPDIEPGLYSIQSILDGDLNFNPFIPQLAQPTSGDLVGAFVNADQTPIPLSVSAPDNYEQTTVVTGQVVPVEPPSFRLDTPALALDDSEGGQIALSIQPLEALGMRPECAAFLISALPEGGAGDVNNDGRTILPRVTLLGLPPDQTPRPTFPAEVLAPPLELGQVLTSTGVTVQIPPGVPPGRYEIRLDTGTGQNWSIPNVLSDVFTGVPDNQGTALTIQ